MPQVDLEALVTACSTGGSDRKIACETTLIVDDPPVKSTTSGDCIAAEAPPDIPPESYWLEKDAESDWLERNAYYERKNSAKGGLSTNSTTSNSNPPANQGSNSNSQRFSVNLKSKASIIGLPKSQKATFADSKRRTCHKPANVRLFPKRGSQSAGKSTVQMAEPGSPKVSCMGRVRSKRCRRRSNSVKRDGEHKPLKEKKAGFCSKVLDMFRSKKGRGGKKMPRSRSKKVAEAVAAEEKPDPRWRSTSVRRRDGISDAEPPGLGGMKRFASGRRSCSSLTGEEAN